MGISDTFFGAGKGALAGAGSGAMIGSAFPPYGTVVGGVIGFIVGAVGGGVEGYYEGEEKDQMVDNQKKTVDENKRINELMARKQARAAHEAAMNNPTASSDQMFTKVALQREADSNYASVRDKGNPFVSREKSGERPPAPFYGNTVDRAA